MNDQALLTIWTEDVTDDICRKLDTYSTIDPISKLRFYVYNRLIRGHIVFITKEFSKTVLSAFMYNSTDRSNLLQDILDSVKDYYHE